MSRLIDADMLIESIVNRTESETVLYNTTEELNAYLEGCAYKQNAIIDMINDLPTAYSVDKVVTTMDEALIELKDGTNCGTCVFKDVCDDGYDGCVQTIVAVCKSIVKKGGASDDVCEWKVFDNSLTDEPQWVYGTTCGKYVEEEHTSKAFGYCPYCGKKIKIVGD